MSTFDLMRAEACVRVISGEFSLAEAASRTGVSYRQMKRIVRRYRKRGAAGLVHQSLDGLPIGRSRLATYARKRWSWFVRITAVRLIVGSGRNWPPNILRLSTA